MDRVLGGTLGSVLSPKGGVKMEWWWKIIVLVIAILAILFPAAYVWNLNISGTYAAIKRAREKRAVRAKEAAGVKISERRGEMTPMRRAAFGALFFLVALLFPVLIWVALFVAIRAPLLRAVKRAGYAALFFLAGVSMPLLIWVGFVVAMRKPLLQAMRRAAYAGLLFWAAFSFASRQLLFGAIGWFVLTRQHVGTWRRVIRPVGYASLLFLVAILVPVLIWVAFAVVARELSLRWRESRLPSTLIATNPPPGFVWVEGRYVPQY